ncbi:MAG TPA: N-acetyltransferase [Acidimicrobiales bacterium]
MTTRTVTPADHDGILDVVREAFTSAERDAGEEIDIVVATWRLGAVFPELELVAVMGDVVIGHVMAARGDLGGREAVGVAPLAVAPSHQDVGTGTALMTELLHRADDARLPLIALLGDPGYYGRFGFEPSGPLGITYRPVGEGNPHFQVRRLSAYDPRYRGNFTYCWEESG